MTRGFRSGRYARLAGLAAAAVLVAALAAGGSFASTSKKKSQKSPAAAIPGSKLGNAAGVSSKTIKFAVLMQLKDCGKNKVNADQLAGTEERWNTLVKWFNSSVAFPGGRKLSVEFIDDGGQDAACNDVARAGALKATQQDHVFAMVSDAAAPGVNLAQIAAQNKTLFIGGSNDQTFADLKRDAPYVWSTYEPAELSFQELTWMIGKRFKHPKWGYRDNNGALHPRIWGGFFQDTPVGHAFATATKKYMAQVGITSFPLYFLSPTEANATALPLQAQQAGVNSLIVGVPDPSFMFAAKNAGYFPDYFLSEYGTLPQLAVFIPFFGFGNRLYATGPPAIAAERVEVNKSNDITPAGCPSCFGQNNGMTVAATTAYKEAGGEAGDHPGVGANGFTTSIWPAIAVLAMGASQAGPVLNAQTFKYALQKSPKAMCMAERFFGKQPYAQAPKFSFSSPPRQYLQSGFTTLHWNPNKTTMAGTKGMFESYDNYQVFYNMKALPPFPRYDTQAAGGYQLKKQSGNISIHTRC